MRKTIGVLAHVDAGKTTFSEQILYHTNSIKSRGRVDHRNSFLDSHSIEKDRGITIFSEQGIFEYNDSTYYLIDTPGHVDFSTEMERAIQIMNYAIIIVSAVEGVQGHSETVWELLRKYSVPTFFFINKIDRTGANPIRVIEEIQSKLSDDACIVEDDLKAGDMNTELIEFISERDENLLELYLEDKFDIHKWIEKMKELIKENRLFPCFKGSALQDIGIEEFIQSLDILTFTEYVDTEEFSGRVYKIRHDENGVRVTHIKALLGKLRVRDEISNGEDKEKVTQIRVYNGEKFIIKDEICSGELFAVTGISELIAGDGIGALKEKTHYNMIPTLRSKVIFDSSINVKDVLRYFRILEAEDPALNVVWDETFKEINIHIMGVIQLEVLKEILKERFNLDVEFGPCEILYKESIEGEVKGYGHFEPLKHYSEVHIKIESGERNSGIIFENRCHADDLTIGQQNLIKTHIFEKEHKGILTGSSLTDLKITLLTGRAHNKHTSGGDFREATLRALRQGLEKANNIILEPYYRFKIDVELDYMGRVLSDIQRLNGEFEAPLVNGDRVSIKGRGPVATFMNYSVEILTFTKGKGNISLVYDGYDLCHNSDEVIEKRAYNKDADSEYSSSSVFCSKGEGFIVKWDEAEEYMHCDFIYRNKL